MKCSRMSLTFTFTLHVAFSIVLNTVMYVLIAQEGLIFVTFNEQSYAFFFQESVSFA